MSRPAFSIFAQRYIAALLNDLGKVYLNTPVPRDPNLRVYKMPSRSNGGTNLLRAMTEGNKRIMISPEVIGEASLVDVLFEPVLNGSRTSLGLLGELLFAPCIIELLRWSPTSWEIQTCLGHRLKWQSETNGGIIPAHEILTDEKKENKEKKKEKVVDKILLIVVPSIRSKQLIGWGAQTSTRNILGVYNLPPAFCTTIVATSELPKNKYTLWLRLLGRGPTQRDAIQELMNLEFNYPHRESALRQLQQWYQLLSEGQMGKENRLLVQLLSHIEV
jgi:hypothetical protein